LLKNKILKWIEKVSGKINLWAWWKNKPYNKRDK